MKAKIRDSHWIVKEEICSTAKEMMRLGLVIGSAGNISCRVPNKEEFFITPSQVDYQFIQPHQIVKLDFAGKQLDGEWTPSSERIMHSEIYLARNDVNSIIHTHSRYASVLSIIGKKIPPLMEEMINILGGAIEIAKFSQVGSKELGFNVVESLGYRKAVLLQNHGVLACGKDLFDALRVAQVVEENAEIYFHILQVGEDMIIDLPDSALTFQQMIFKSLNRIPRKKKKKQI